ncbi:MAG: ribosome silencing factor [Oscillospiraceae bacterium]
MEGIDIAKTAAKVLSEKLAKDVKILKIEGLSAICDYFVIANGSSLSQVKALSEYADKALAVAGVNARKVEGEQNANWILMDYNSVIIHIFDEEARKFYAMERLWADAPQIEF